MKTINEAKTRYLMIDPALTKAGWNLGNHSQVRFETPIPRAGCVQAETCSPRRVIPNIDQCHSEH